MDMTAYLFLKSLLHHFNSYSWFRNSAIWLVENLSDLTKLKIFKSTFICFNLSQHAENHTDWPKIWLAESSSDYVQLTFTINKPFNTNKPFFMFAKLLSSCQKSSWFINFFLRYCWFKTPVILLAESILLIAQEPEFS